MYDPIIFKCENCDQSVSTDGEISCRCEEFESEERTQPRATLSNLELIAIRDYPRVKEELESMTYRNDILRGDNEELVRENGELMKKLRYVIG